MARIEIKAEVKLNSDQTIYILYYTCVKWPVMALALEEVFFAEVVKSQSLISSYLVNMTFSTIAFSLISTSRDVT